MCVLGARCKLIAAAAESRIVCVFSRAHSLTGSSCVSPPMQWTALLLPSRFVFS